MRWKDLKEAKEESVFRNGEEEYSFARPDRSRPVKTPDQPENAEVQSQAKEPENQTEEPKKPAKAGRKKKSGKKPTKRQHEIHVAGALLVSMLLATLAYFIYFEVEGTDEVLSSEYNTRLQNMAQLIRKGDIVTSDGVVVATTQTREDGTEVRAYPYTNQFTHTVGYSAMGGYGLERTQRKNLLTSHVDAWSKLKNEFLGVKTQGDTLVTTLDYGLQDYCYRQLDGKNGTIIVSEPETGKILAMVSAPNFDPNTVAEQWSSLSSGERGAGILINRASQGTYAPGSTFKIITLLEYIRENPDTWQDFHYTCTGSYVNGAYVVNCHDQNAHGDLDLYGALEYSCNGAFDTMAQELDAEKWQQLAEKFGYNKSETLEIPYVTSKFHIDTDDSVWARMQLAIGQGTTTVTPLLNLMMYAAIANDGVMMTPYLVDSYVDANGNLVGQAEPTPLRTVCTGEEALLLDNFLNKVITNGTAYMAASEYARVSGKTGSAQYGSGQNYHAWFCGYGSDGTREIAVCVLIEEGGSGGMVAAPIAGSIFNYYFSR